MNKKLRGFYLKPLFRILVAISVIALATSITAVSCGKTPDAGGGTTANNTNTNAGGGSNGGGGNNTPIAPELKITANQAVVTANLFKIEASGDMKINATKLATDTQPYGVRVTTPTMDDKPMYVTNAVRLIEAKSTDIPALFTIELMRNSTTAAEGGIVLVVASTNTNNIALKSVADSTRDVNMGDNWGIWKRSVDTAGANFFQLISFERPVHDGAGVAQSNGRLICATEKLEKVHDAATATDATKLPFAKATCYFGVFSKNLASPTSEINDAWVDDTLTIKMAELRVMGIYTGDTGLGKLSDAAGWDKSSFFGAQDNTAMKAIIAKNKYVEKTFKITVVKSSAF